MDKCPQFNYTQADLQWVWERKLLPASIEILVCVLGTLANLLVLYLWFRIARKADDYNHQDSTRVHNNSHWFILGMTLADFLYSSIQSPLIAAMFLRFYPPFNYGQGTKYLAVFTQSVTAASSLNILLLNLDKFIYIFRPLRYYGIVTKWRAIGALITSWMIAIAGSAVFIFGPFIIFVCWRILVMRPNAYITFTSIYFMLPIIISFWISVYIAIISLRALKGSMDYPLDIGSDHRQSTSSTRSIHRKFIRTIVFIFIMTFWITLAYVPYRVIYTLYSMNRFDHVNNSWLLYATYGLRSLAAAGNPFITMMVQPDYKRQLQKLFTSTKRNNSGQMNAKNGGPRYASYSMITTVPVEQHQENAKGANAFGNNTLKVNEP